MVLWVLFRVPTTTHFNMFEFVSLCVCYSDNNVTVAYTSDFERFPPVGYIRRTLIKTKLEGRSKYLYN